MNKIYFLILLIFISCKHENPNLIYESCDQLRTALKNENDTSTLKITLNKAYELAEIYTNKQHDSLIALGSRVMGNSLLSAKNNLGGREYYKNGLKYGRRLMPQDENIICKLYRNTAITYQNLLNFKTALIYYDSIIIKGNDDAAKIKKVHDLINIATCYNGINDYNTSDKFYTNALPLAKQYLSKAELADFYNNHSMCLYNLKEYDKSIESSKKALKILNENLNNNEKVDSISIAISNLNIATAFEDSLQYKLAEKYYNIALPIFNKLGDLGNIATVYLNTSYLHLKDKQYDKTIKLSSKGIEILKDVTFANSYPYFRKGELFINRSQAYLGLKDYNKALNNLDSAISYLTQYHSNPVLTELLLNNRHLLLEVYNDKAQILINLDNKKGDSNGYQKALKQFDKIIELIDDIRADYISNDAKMTFTAKLKPSYEKAIGLCQTLYQKSRDIKYLQQAFVFAEHSRSMILNENTHLNNQLPKELIRENDQLKALEASNIQNNSTENLENYLKKKRQFREQIKSFNKSKKTDVIEIQKSILKDSNTIIVEYFLGDSTLYIITITNDSVNIESNNNVKQIIENVKKIRETIAFEKTDEFKIISGELYQQLLPQWVKINKNQGKNQRLIIVPDGVLSFVPFEVLSQNDTSIKDKSLKEVAYLLKNYNISYTPSINFLIENNKKKNTSIELKSFMGFAPEYNVQDTFTDIFALRSSLTRDGAYTLPHANEEVVQIHNIIGGELYLNSKADEFTFKNQSSKAKILHLAMHAITDNSNPTQSRLLFTKNIKDTLNDNDLTIEELNTLTLNADLAVLSACNTGYGKLYKGEGVMSLARAFHFAGVPATVMSLWKVPDKETSELMVEFYQNIKKGQNKDEALRNAKLHYLANVKLVNKAAPLYWSAFILSGNTNSIDFDNNYHLSYWLLGIIFLICLIIYFLKYLYPKKL